MPRTATVNYHVHKAERQSFQIDAGGVVGNLISPELAVTEVRVNDVRTGGAVVAFDRDAVAFVDAPSEVTSFASEDDWRAIYDRELTRLLESELGVTEVVIFDHTVRVDDPEAARKPARNVHSDYSVDGARQRLVDILGPEKASEWSQGHYAFINVWRPVDHPINSAPPGFVRPSSQKESDWILLDLIYPDRVGQIMGLAANPQHEWVYQSRMTPGEVAFFNIYDNSGLPSIAHSALDMVEDEAVRTMRKSIESRTLVHY